MYKLPRRLFNGIATLTMFAVGTLSAHAHPGHGLLESTPSHVMSSPYHIAVLALSGMALFFGARLAHRRLPCRILQIAGTAVLVGAAVLLANHI